MPTNKQTDPCDTAVQASQRVERRAERRLFVVPVRSTPIRRIQPAAKRSMYLKAKRAIDIAVVLAIGPAVLLVVIVAALAILISMGRPILFVQDRVGLEGRVFRMLKLRTMQTGLRIVDHATVKDDPRITPLGAFLRQTHIDELPQLWNILTGDMTLIGPRPEQPHLVAHYREHIPDYDRRHTVPPGLSGLSQVAYGYAADLEETRQKVVYDLQYVDGVSPSLDLSILFRTIRIYADPRFVR
jgi:lipopolysaccharide/colanic/teichoic acid biosynthesis glycosyltransferase